MKPHNNKSNVYSLTSKVFPKKSAVCSLQSAVSPHSAFRNSHSRAGFTLLELLIVISLIMVLAGLMIPAFYKVQDGARNKRAEIERKILEHAIRAYKVQAGRFPAPVGDLRDGGSYVYGNAADGNHLVMQELTNVVPPVLDSAKMAWDLQGNVINPWGNQYKITLNLETDECSID